MNMNQCGLFEPQHKVTQLVSSETNGEGAFKSLFLVAGDKGGPLPVARRMERQSRRR
jgi:hypothetical protein